MRDHNPALPLAVPVLMLCRGDVPPVYSDPVVAGYPD